MEISEQRKARRRAYNAAYRIANKEVIHAQRAGYRAERREKAKAITAAWRAANPDRSRTLAAAWRAANRPRRAAQDLHRAARRRAEKHGTYIQLTLDERTKIIDLYEQAYIRRRNGEQVQMDHVVPIADGGRHELANLQVLPEEDHLAKTKAEAIARYAAVA